MKKRSTILLLMAALLICHAASAQSCPFRPADCPVNGADSYGTADDSTQRLLNPVVPEEITMENKLRRWMSSLLGRIAGSRGWQLVELAEESGSGYRSPDGAVLPYAYRPPHWYIATWQFIVNSDSLAAWKAWLEDFSRQRMDKLDQYAADQQAADDRGKPYRDSAEYYDQVMSRYMQDHIAQYQKDLLAENKPGISAYEKAVAGFRKRADYYIQKAGEMANAPAAAKESETADALKKSRTIHFRDASVLVVEFGFNPDYVKTAGTATGAGAGAGGAPFWYSNPAPDPVSVDLFNRSRTNVLLLEGAWTIKAPANGGFRPAFCSDKSSVDLTTPKRIKCDQVQTVDCHISGNPQAIRQFLAALPAQELKAFTIN